MNANENRSTSISDIVPGIEKFALKKPAKKARRNSTTEIVAVAKKKEKPQNDGIFCNVEDGKHFFNMCDLGNVEQIVQLLKINPLLISQTNDNGYTCMHHAAGKSRLNAIDILLFKGADINAKANNGDTPLHVAIERNRIDSVRHLLTKTAINPAVVNNQGVPPLHLAVALNRPAILEELLSSDRVDVELTGPHSARASHYACSLNDPACLGILMKHRCMVCQVCELGFYPIHVAIKCGTVDTVRYMLDHLEELPYGYTIDKALNFADKERNTPLHLAVNGGDVDAIQVCLDYGARVDSVQENKSTPFHFACSQGSLPIVRLLYEAHLAQVEKKNEVEKNGEERNLLDAKDCLDMTPLHRAAIYDHANVVQYLIEQESTLNVLDRQLRTPLLLAVTRGGSKTANLLLDAGANIAAEDIQKQNILHYLVLNASNGFDLVPLIERIVQDPNGRILINNKDLTGCTPLHVASRAGNVRFTETLLRLGAIVRLKDKDEQSPLHFAAKYGRYNTVKRLLDSPTGPNIINETENSGATALHIASANGHAKIVQLLMCKGALIHKDHTCRSPLHLAVENGHPDTLQVLLTFHGNLLDAKCASGGSPLHIAASCNQPGCVNFLLSANCEYVVNNELKTPLDLAIEKQNVEAAMAMIEHDRWEEILTTYDQSGVSPVLRLIERMPEVYKVALDRSITKSSDNKTSNKPDWVKYSFKFVESDVLCKHSSPKSNNQPLPTLNAMVEFGRIDLLSHPICLTYLKTKWLTYGFWFFFITMLFYAIFVMCLTLSILFGHEAVMYSGTNITKIGRLLDVQKAYDISLPVTFYNQLIFLYIFFYSVYNLIKESVYVFHQPWIYFTELVRYTRLIMYMTAITFAYPIFTATSYMIMCRKYGSITIFLGWFNLVIYLQRLDGVGLYIVMFRQILSTVFKVIVLFSGLFVAFGLAFYLLLWTEKEADFKTPLISIVQTVMCMMGEWNYVDLFANPYFAGSMNYPPISLGFLILFVALMPILFINLLIGLAVGDIGMVQKDANLKRLAMQIEYHTELEKVMPTTLLEKWKRNEVIKYNSKNCVNTGCLSVMDYFRALLRGSRISKITKDRNRDALKSNVQFEKTKKNLEAMHKKIDILNDLIRQIVQKMEIGVEADHDFDQYAVIAGH